MRPILLLAGAAALIVASDPALAQGKGEGHGKGGGQAAAHDGGRGRGDDGPARAQTGRVHREDGKGQSRNVESQRERAAPGPGLVAGRGQERKRAALAADRERSDRGKKADRAPSEPPLATRELPGVDRGRKGEGATGGRAFVQRFATRRWTDDGYRYDGPNAILTAAGGCPPGLAKKNNGCLPPGQARKLVPAAGWPSWYPLRHRNDEWWYGAGYLYRTDPRNALVTAFVPLLGGGLFGGNIWPSQYTSYEVPPYYERFYGYDDAYDYRYADDAIFAVDPQTQTIQAIAALLTGDDWEVGRPMPEGYDLYNLPPDFRGRYVDGPDAWYRYSDGYIYEVDPTTRLVRSVIELLA